MKRTSKVIITVLLLALTLGGTVLGANVYRTVQALQMHDIKVVVDGVEQILVDANGNKIVPISINGSTYLPIRAIGRAVGKEVNWDGNTKTVYLGEIVGETEYKNLVPTNMKGKDGYYDKSYYTYDKDLLSIGEKVFEGGIAFYDGGGFTVTADINVGGLSEMKFTAYNNKGNATIYVKDRDSGTVLSKTVLTEGVANDVEFKLHGASVVRVSIDMKRWTTTMIADPKLR